MADWITETIQTIGSAAGGAGVGWFFTRKKQAAEVQSTHLENVKKALQIFQNDVVDPLRRELKESREETAQLKRELSEARLEIEQLRAEVKRVHHENMELKRR